MRFLAAVDRSAASEVALARVQALRDLVTSLRLLHVDPGEPSDEARSRGIELLRSAANAACLEPRGLTLEVAFGKAPDAIVKAASGRADVVVLGTAARSPLGRLTHASVAEAVAVRSPVPTLVVRDDLVPAAIERVLVAIDFSRPALDALGVAVFLGQRLRVPLAAIHVMVAPPGVVAPTSIARGVPGAVLPPLLDDAARELEAFLGRLPLSTDVDMTVVAGTPHVAIGRAARPGDLLVCGTHGRPLLERLVMGSVARKLMRAAPCPIVVVRPRGAADEREVA